MLLMEVIMLDRNSKPVFIAGGTGKTGRRVAERLTARGIAVRIGSRQAAPAFDWNDRATWADAVSGAGAAYITYYPDVTMPGAVETVRRKVIADQLGPRLARELGLTDRENDAEARRSRANKPKDET